MSAPTIATLIAGCNDFLRECSRQAWAAILAGDHARAAALADAIMDGLETRADYERMRGAP